MRLAQSEKQAAAAAAAAEACPKIDEAKPADMCSPSERTRTPSTAGSDGDETQLSEGEENRAAVAASSVPAVKKEASFDFSGPQFSRGALLQFRDFAKDVPSELETMKIVEEEDDEPADRALFGTFPLMTSPSREIGRAHV